MKKCPFCAEEIQDEAVKCKHCGEWLTEDGRSQSSIFGDAASPASFDVVLASPGAKKIQVIQVIRRITKLGLKEAKDLVDRTPSVLLTDLSAEGAANVRETLLPSGADVQVVPHEGEVPESVTGAVVHAPRCLTCGSTNVHRITGAQKLGRVALIGVFAAPKAMKSYECLNCKARW